MKPFSPTPYSDVNEILDTLLTNAHNILQDQVVGTYLFGSLANGDFDEHSDIDVLIVTDGDISANDFNALEEMHAKINQLDSPWAIQLEVSYIPQNALRRFDPNNRLFPHMDRGSKEVLHMKSHESDWIIQRHLLRQSGIVISGPDLQSIIDPVSPQDLRQAVIDELPLWNDFLVNHPTSLKSRGYQSFCVLSFCRMLYTFQNKAVLSKPAAAKWGLATLDERWHPLIERAIVGRHNPHLEVDSEEINETLAMMRFVLDISKQPSIFPDVNEVLSLLLTHVKEILGDQFVGMYLYGSLSSGDFNPHTSDIDFLVVTEDVLPEGMVAALEIMHKSHWANSLKRAGQLEGSYIPRELIRRHDPNGVPCPTVNEGKFYVDQRGSDWIIQRHVIREYGVVIEGPDPRTLIDPVSAEDIRGAVMGILHEWWFPMLDDPSWLREHDSHYRAFAVITMCRVLHALECGKVVSKPKATDWTHTRLGEPWKELIERATAVSNHEELDITLNETLDFIRYTKEMIKS